MAHELELEWWRPQGGQAVDAEPLAETAPAGQAALPFWAVMAFTAVLLFSPQTYVPALAPLRPALLVILIGVLSYVSDRWARGVPIFEWNRELGLIAGRMEKLSEFFVSPGFCEEKMWLYLATQLSESKQNLDDDEIIQVVKISLEDALEMISDGEIEDAKTIIALLLTANCLKSRNSGEYPAV